MSTKYELSDKNLFQYDIDDKQHTKLVDCIKEENTKQIKKDKKQIFAVLQTKNPFEFPRQHENGQSKATEIGQFKASQRLLNHNQMDQMSDSIWSRPTFSTKGPETNNSTSYASFSSASSNGTTGSSSSFLNSELSPPEKVKAEAIDDAFKVATESINQ
uniref:Uncharacterized protein n=1 Tax=Panagrolaimus davidi TaxID=227884 RepID=A0A914QHU7_9BILA